MRPDPLPPGLPDTWAAAGLDDALRGVITAYKDHGRRDLTPFLGGLLAGAVAAALARDGRTTLLVPVPTRAAARRRRGDAPMMGLALAAAAQLDQRRILVAAALRPARTSQDQARLTREQRACNLIGAWEVDPRWRAAVAAHRVLVVDDIMTTGSTLVEAARALSALGAGAEQEVAAAVIAATRLRRPRLREGLPQW